MKSIPSPAGASAFRIREVPASSDVQLRLVLSGSLDVDGAPSLMERLREILKRGVIHVDLDFTEVSFVSSLGIGTLIAAIGEYREVQGDIGVGGLSKEILAVFEMLDLLDFVTLRS